MRLNMWDGSDGNLGTCRWRLEWLIGVQSANSPMEESWKVDMVAPMCGMRSWSKGLGVPGVCAWLNCILPDGGLGVCLVSCRPSWKLD